MLTPEVRKMVAEECGNHPESLLLWDPNSFTHQWKALTTTAARLIEELKKDFSHWPDADTNYKVLIVGNYQAKLQIALATNDTDALELLVAELKGFV